MSEVSLVRIADALERIADALEKQAEPEITETRSSLEDLDLANAYVGGCIMDEEEQERARAALAPVRPAFQASAAGKFSIPFEATVVVNDPRIPEGTTARAWKAGGWHYVVIHDGKENAVQGVTGHSQDDAVKRAVKAWRKHYGQAG